MFFRKREREQSSARVWYKWMAWSRWLNMSSRWEHVTQHQDWCIPTWPASPAKGCSAANGAPLWGGEALEEASMQFGLNMQQKQSDCDNVRVCHHSQNQWLVVKLFRSYSAVACVEEIRQPNKWGVDGDSFVEGMCQSYLSALAFIRILSILLCKGTAKIRSSLFWCIHTESRHCSLIEGIDCQFEKCAYSPSCLGLDEKIDATLLSVW